MRTEFLLERYEALAVVFERDCLAFYERSLRLESFSNGRGASRSAVFAKAGKLRLQRHVGLYAGRLFKEHMKSAVPFFVVRCLRIAPRSLDGHDNLGAAFKATIDGVAEGLGIDDRDSRVRYVVDQQRGKPKQHLVRLELYAAPEPAFVDWVAPAPTPKERRKSVPTLNVVKPK